MFSRLFFITMLFGFARVNSSGSMSIHVSNNYYVKYQTVEINCTSTVSVENNHIVIIVNRQIIASIYFKESTGKCMRLIDLNHIDCSEKCKCTTDGKSIAYVYNETTDNSTLELMCVSSSPYAEDVTVITKANGPKYVALKPSITSYTVTETTGSVGPITCTADCRPNCTMTWNGPNLPGGTISDLIVQNINRNQTGDYRCTAMNSFGSMMSETVKVIVNYGPNSVVIIPSTTLYTVTEITGSVGPIICTADCRPKCTITWSGPNLPGDTISVLNVRNINRNQTGDYRCTAINDVGRFLSEKVTVRVYYVPSILRIQGNTTFTVNGTAEFRCDVDSVPKSQIKWIFVDANNTLILPYINTTIYEVNGNQLKVYPLNCLSMGLYICEASNGVGMTQKNINLTVLCSPKLNILEYDIVDMEAIAENEPLQLTVPVLAYPKPTLYWQFKKDHHISNITKGVTNRHYVKRHMSSLIIYDMKEEDFGVYTIYGSNTVDVNSQIQSYHVVAARRPQSPRYVVALCKSSLLTITWWAGFNGGDNQMFKVEVTNNRTGEKISTDNITDPGNGKYLHYSINVLAVDSQYVVVVKSSNIYGESNSTTEVKCNSNASSNVYEETKSDFGPANIYNDLNDSTIDDPNKGNSTRIETDTPCTYDKVLTPKSEVNKKGRNPPKTGSAIYMNTEI